MRETRPLRLEALSPGLQARIRLLRARLVRALFFSRLLRVLPVSGFAAGFLLLISRRLAPQLGFLAPLWWAAVACAVPVALYLTVRERPSLSMVVALADKLGNADGLLCAVAECGDRRWAARLPPELASFPFPHYRLPRTALAPSLALVFFGACLFLPQRKASTPRAARAFSERIAAVLAKEVSILNKLPLVPEEKKQLEKALKDLSHQAKTAVDSSVLESVDEATRQVAEKLSESTRRMKKVAENARALREKLSESTRKEGEAGGEEKRRKAVRGLRENLAQCAVAMLKGGFRTALDAESEALLRKAAQDLSELSPEELRRMARKLLSQWETVKDRVRWCREELSRAACSACRLGCGAEGLAALKEQAHQLREMGSGETREPRPQEPGRPGSGGITRGPGPAPLLLGSASGGSASRIEMVPPRVIFPTEKDVTFTKIAPPERSTEPAEGSSVAGSHAPETSKAPLRAPLPPSRRKTVRRYFSPKPEGRTR